MWSCAIRQRSQPVSFSAAFSVHRLLSQLSSAHSSSGQSASPLSSASPSPISKSGPGTGIGSGSDVDRLVAAVCKLKLWNYNRSLKDLSVGARHVTLTLHERVLFDGELERGCGNYAFDYGVVVVVQHGSGDGGAADGDSAKHPSPTRASTAAHSRPASATATSAKSASTSLFPGAAGLHKTIGPGSEAADRRRDREVRQHSTSPVSQPSPSPAADQKPKQMQASNASPKRDLSAKKEPSPDSRNLKPESSPSKQAIAVKKQIVQPTSNSSKAAPKSYSLLINHGLKFSFKRLQFNRVVQAITSKSIKRSKYL